MGEWYLYIIRMGNGHLYTGITTDVERRFAEHNGRGLKAAKSLRGRGPLTLVFSQEVGSRSTASKAEWAVKQLSKEDKEALVNGRLSLETVL